MKRFFRNFYDFTHRIPFWIFIIPIFLMILFPYITDITPEKITENTEFNIISTENELKVLKIIDELQKNSKVLILVNFGPESKYELETALSSLIAVLAEKEIKIAFATMLPNGIESAFYAAEKSIDNGKLGMDRFVYGHEYTHLGYIAGGTIASYLAANNFDKIKERDIVNNNIDIRQPIMNEIADISDFSAVFEFSSQTFDGIPAIISFSVLLKNKEIKRIAFCTSDILSAYIPFSNSLYLDGLVGGFKSIAAFIHEIRPSAQIEQQYDSLSIILFYIVGIVFFANLIRVVRKDK